jgi:phage baseplate assembly protein W
MADLSIRAREKVYTDLDFAFRENTITSDVSLKKDVEAVKQSVLNILLTNKGERPFLPTFGANIRSHLFENIDSVTSSLIEEDITFALRNFEPRVRVLSVNVEEQPERNAVNITLDVEIISPVRTTATIEFSVERVR